LGHEGIGILPPEELIPTDDLDAYADSAARFIIEKAAAHPGELSLITIASMACRLTTFCRRHVRLEVHDSVLRTMAYPDREPNVRIYEDVDAPTFVRFWLERVRWLATSS
jgi:hypothetical protein